jgi:integrase
MGRRSDLNALAQTWLDSRAEMASNYDDRLRWNRHWDPLVGRLDANDVDVSTLKRSIGALRRKGLAKATVGLCVRLLSSFYSELVEEGVADQNPCRLLSKKTRSADLKPDWDPKKTPFVRDPGDIAKIYQWLRPRYRSIATAYAVGALAGLRTGEVRALPWDHVDLERRLIHVQVQAERPRGRAPELLSLDGTSTPKDDDSRWVPISDALYPILAEAHATSGGYGLVCPPQGSRGRFIGEKGMASLLSDALAACGVEPMVWYQATRHTFASQWVLHGGSLEKLKEMMGHSSVIVTERYAHLVPGRFTDLDRSRVALDMVAQ